MKRQGSPMLWLLSTLLLLLLTSWAHAHGTGASVVQLTASNFKSLVLDSDQVWMVGFFAPWCGHCQRLAPDWEKAAAKMKGYVSFGAVNCDEEKGLAQQYGIQGFPTIKLFPAGKKTSGSALDYQGQRSATAMANYAASQIPNKVKALRSLEVADAFLGKSGPKAILFTEKSKTPTLIKALAFEFRDVMAFGEVRHTDAEIVNKYGGTSFPLVKVFTEEHPEGKVFMGQISKLSLGKFLASFVSAKVEAKDAKGDSHVEEKKQVIRPPEVAEDFRQVTSLEELRALSQQVEEKNRVLVLFLLPKLEEQVGAARQVAIEYRKDLLFTFAAAPLSGDFLSLWSGAESGGQVAVPALEVDVPRVLIARPKRKRVAMVDASGGDSTSTLNLEAVHQTLDRVIGGDLTFSSIRVPAGVQDWIAALASSSPRQEEL